MRDSNAGVTRRPNVFAAVRAGSSNAGSSWSAEISCSGSVMARESSRCQAAAVMRNRLLERFDLDVAEPDGLAFGLQRDVPVRELQRRARGHQALRVFIPRV